MARWSIRDLWGRLTQKPELNPEMRNMLLKLDGVYEPTTSASGDKPPAAGAAQGEGSHDSRG